jgi:hypothetical protein
MKRLLAALLLVPTLVWGATTWSVVKPTDCTGVGVPGACCQATASVSQATCNLRNSAGMWTQYHVDLRTVGSGNTYTAGGDPVPASVFGMAGIAYATCYSQFTVDDYFPQAIPTGTGIKLRLWLANGNEVVAPQSTNGIVLTCDVFGH